MLMGLGDRKTEAGRIKVIPRRSQSSSSIENTMGDFPGKINDLKVSVQEEKFPPRSRQIKDNECGKELNHTVRGAQVFR